MTDLAEIVRDRRELLIAWATWSVKQGYYGEVASITAQQHMNRIADLLGDFTEADWGIIRNAQRKVQP